MVHEYPAMQTPPASKSCMSKSTEADKVMDNVWVFIGIVAIYVVCVLIILTLTLPEPGAHVIAKASFWHVAVLSPFKQGYVAQFAYVDTKNDKIKQNE